MSIPITTIRTIVAAGPAGVPETIGVGFIKRRRSDGSVLNVRVSPPRKDLLDVDLRALSDAEIESLGTVA